MSANSRQSQNLAGHHDTGVERDLSAAPHWSSAFALVENASGYTVELNLYSHALNNPVAFVDPNGLSTWVATDTSKIMTVIDDDDPSVYGVSESDNATVVKKMGELVPRSGRLPVTGQLKFKETIEWVRNRGNAYLHNAKETGEVVGAAILQHEQEGFFASVGSHMSQNEFDYKGSADLFDLGDGEIVEGDQFGNFLAGAAATASFGAVGEAGVRAGGHVYAFFDQIQDGKVGGDDPGSVEMIDRGVAFAGSYTTPNPEDLVCR